MSEVERYDCVADGWNMMRDDEGYWVSYEDYAALQQKLDAVAAELVTIKEKSEDVYAAGYRQGHLNTVDGIAYAPPIKDEFYHNALQVMLEIETPANDKILNALRAEGVELLAKYMGANDTRMAVTAEAIMKYATQLRNG